MQGVSLKTSFQANAMLSNRASFMKPVQAPVILLKGITASNSISRDGLAQFFVHRNSRKSVPHAGDAERLGLLE